MLPKKLIIVSNESSCFIYYLNEEFNLWIIYFKNSQRINHKKPKNGETPDGIVDYAVENRGTLLKYVGEE